MWHGFLLPDYSFPSDYINFALWFIHSQFLCLMIDFLCFYNLSLWFGIAFVFFILIFVSLVIIVLNIWFPLYQLQDGCGDSFPDELECLLNRRFIFKVQISDFNINKGSQTYTVKKMSDDIQLIQLLQNSSTLSQVTFFVL